MARDRLTLQAELRKFAPRVWYKRPPDNKMSYPCIVYRMSNPQTRRADNRVYMYTPCYNVVYMSDGPDDAIGKAMLEHFEHCAFDREYETDGLYHYSFVLYW